MEVTTATGPVTVLTVIGSLNSVTFPQLVDEVDKVLGADHRHLVLDLEGVDYVSSGGLVALQTIAGRAAAQGGRAALCSVQPAVEKVLEVSGFDQALDVYPDLAAAVASFETT